MGGLGLGAILLIYFGVKLIGSLLDGDKEPEDRTWTDNDTRGRTAKTFGGLGLAFLFGLAIPFVMIIILT